MLGKRKRGRRRKRSRFTPMSKILGIFIILLIAAIIGYSMYEMHNQCNLESLPQLIISVFALGTAYIAFYLNMAKWEHIEQEKTEREKQIIKLKKELGQYCPEEEIEKEIEELEGEVEKLTQKEEEIENEDIDANA